MSRFFVDRPIFATVLSIVIIVIGLVALARCPSRSIPRSPRRRCRCRPSIPAPAPASWPTPSPRRSSRRSTASRTCSTCSRRAPTTARCTSTSPSSSAPISTTPRCSTRTAWRSPRPSCPRRCKRQGVTTKKKSPSILLCVNLISPDKSRDKLYLSNYATIQVKDDLARLRGVGDVTFLGARDYSMRVWLDPERLAALSMTASDVVQALREQNVQVAAGRHRAAAGAARASSFQYPINTLGRLLEPERVRRHHRQDRRARPGDARARRRPRRARRQELRRQQLPRRAPSVTLAVFQLPGLERAGHRRRRARRRWSS